MNLYAISSTLGSILHDKKLSVVTAESCTGGWIAQELTAIPGSSNWFKQGWVTYSNESKTKELGVPAELITKYGAVSQQVVIAMSNGALANSSGSISLATSGVAGPGGGSEVNPVGTVWIAIAIKGGQIVTECLHLDGDRKSIREQTVEIILHKLKDLLISL